MDNKITECISVLKFISDIKQGEKPCYFSKTVISKNEWFGTIKRRWNGEKGENGIVYVNKILDRCEHYCRMCMNESVYSTLKQLIESLEFSLVGINNLITTYNDQTDVRRDYMEIRFRIVAIIGFVDKHLNEDSSVPVSPNNNDKNGKTNFFSLSNVIIN